MNPRHPARRARGRRGSLAAPSRRRPGQAAAHCGATITKDTKLTRTSTNCHGVGIRIGADGITLDLNGHTVAAAAKRNPKAHGILNVGHDRVTIKGGTVKGFGAYGVRLADAKRTRRRREDDRQLHRHRPRRVLEQPRRAQRHDAARASSASTSPAAPPTASSHNEISRAASAPACSSRPRSPTTAATTGSSRT